MHLSAFALRRSALPILTLALGLLLAACSSGGGEATESAAGGDTAGGTVAVENGVVEVTAENLEFNAEVIEAPAGEDFTIRLVNNDTAPHNISVYSEEGGEEIAKGDTAEGGATVETVVPALEPGEYYFVCDIHPNMNGTLVVEG